MKRNSSIELLRILSILLIVMMHVYSLIDYSSASGINSLIGGGINSLGNIGVSCFVLISGYFGVKFKLHKFIYLVILTTVYSVVVSLFRYGLEPVPFIKAILTVPTYSLWFIVCYLILMVLSPWLNKFTTSLSKRDYALLIGVLIILFSIIPTLFNGGSNNIVLRQGGKNLTYFLFLYLLGRFIRLHNDRDYNRWRLWGIHLICTLMAIILNMAVSKLLNTQFALFYNDCSPLMLLSALCIFYLFKTWSFHSSIINGISSSVLAFYLLSEIHYYFDDTFIHLSEYSSKSSFILWLFVEVFIVWIFSFIIDKSVGKAISYLIDKIYYSISNSKGVYRFKKVIARMNTAIDVSLYNK